MKRIILFLLTICFFANMSVQAQSKGQKMLNMARKGDVAAMRIVSGWYVNGIEGLKRDKTKGLFWARKAAEKGDLKAMYYVTLLIDDVSEKGEDSEKLYWALKGAKRYDATLELITAQIYQRLGILMVESDGNDYDYKYSDEKREQFLKDAIMYAKRAKNNYYTTSEIESNAISVIKLSAGALSQLGVEINLEE